MQSKTTSGRFALATSCLVLGTYVAGATEAPGNIDTVEVPHQVSLIAAGDADVQGGAPDANYGSDTLMHIGNPDKSVYVYFDLSSIPAGATVTKARLVMNVAGSGNAQNEVKLGVVRSGWRESKVTYANRPDVAWTQRTKTISAAGAVHWNVKKPVEEWVSGGHRNRGFAIQSTGQGPIWAFLSREGSPEESRPTLHIAFTTTGALPEPRPSDADVQNQSGRKQSDSKPGAHKR